MQNRCIPRFFNTIEHTIKETVIKTGDIEGERFWYKHIPEEVSDMFPILVSDTSDYIELEEINGIPLSYLYTGETFNETNLQQVFNYLRRIHKCNTKSSITYNIYANYETKLIKRFNNYPYSYKDKDVIFNLLYKRLCEYSKKDRGVLSVIHGDPVFTNIICDMTNSYKFIDMRGKLGEDLTIYGDKFYDYAKVYQSLVGYDYILHDIEFNYSYMNTLKEYFKEYISSRYGLNRFYEIQLITASLLFTLIPLHNVQDQCDKYYDLARGLLI